MKRFPDGVEGKSFFEKHIPSHAPDWVRSVDVPANDGQDVIPYAMVNDLPTLAWAANLGTIELHVPLWHVGRRRKLPARPDHMVFDLDPGEGTSIVECCVVAGYVMDELDRAGNRSRSPRRAGRRACSSTRPSGRRRPGTACATAAHEIARKLESEHPDLVVSNMRKSLRRGRVLIDWSQNHSAKTTVAVYSVRAMPTPTVSTPVTPAEVQRCAAKRDPRVLRFETDDVLRRVDKDGDLFAPLGLAPDVAKSTQPGEMLWRTAVSCVGRHSHNRSTQRSGDRRTATILRHSLDAIGRGHAVRSATVRLDRPPGERVPGRPEAPSTDALRCASPLARLGA